MDTDRFDILTQLFTDARSRRGAFAALLGSPLAILAVGEAEAKKGKRKNKRKRKNKKKLQDRKSVV